jgi:hypothetical protein
VSASVVDLKPQLQTSASESPDPDPTPLNPVKFPLLQLQINASCIDESIVPTLLHISGLELLELHDPTRAVLTRLPEWLGKLSNSLRNLHLLVSIYAPEPRLSSTFIASPA